MAKPREKLRRPRPPRGCRAIGKQKKIGLSYLYYLSMPQGLEVHSLIRHSLLLFTRGRVMAQAVSRRSLTAEVRVRSRGSVVDKVALGQVFLRVLRFSPVNFIGMEKQKKNLIIFLIRLHYVRSICCGALQ
jgi:hypothetical protein